MKKFQMAFNIIAACLFLLLIIWKWRDIIKNENKILINGWHTSYDKRDGFGIKYEGFMHIITKHTKIRYQIDEFGNLIKLKDTVEVLKILAYAIDTSSVFCKVLDRSKKFYTVKTFRTKTRIDLNLNHNAIIDDKLINKNLVWEDGNECRTNYILSIITIVFFFLFIILCVAMMVALIRLIIFKVKKYL